MRIEKFPKRSDQFHALLTATPYVNQDQKWSYVATDHLRLKHVKIKNDKLLCSSIIKINNRWGDYTPVQNDLKVEI